VTAAERVPWTATGVVVAVVSAAALVAVVGVDLPDPPAVVGTAAVYALLLATSGHVVRAALWFAGVDDPEEEADTGRAVGKVENVLVLTLVLLEAYTALGLVFTAKSIVRYQDMNSGNTTYYLTGSVANFTYSLVYGVVAAAVVGVPPV